MVIHNIEARDHPVVLKQCEAVLEEGFESLLKIAKALKVIKEFHLYQGEYRCFEEYCKAKFKLEQKDADSLLKLMHLS